MLPAGTRWTRGGAGGWRGQEGHVKRQERQVRKPTRNEGLRHLSFPAGPLCPPTR